MNYVLRALVFLLVGCVTDNKQSNFCIERILKNTREEIYQICDTKNFIDSLSHNIQKDSIEIFVPLKDNKFGWGYSAAIALYYTINLNESCRKDLETMEYKVVCYYVFDLNSNPKVNPAGTFLIEEQNEEAHNQQKIYQRTKMVLEFVIKQFNVKDYAYCQELMNTVNAENQMVIFEQPFVVWLFRACNQTSLEYNYRMDFDELIDQSKYFTETQNLTTKLELLKQTWLESKSTLE